MSSAHVDPRAHDPPQKDRRRGNVQASKTIGTAVILLKDDGAGGRGGVTSKPPSSGRARVGRDFSSFFFIQTKEYNKTDQIESYCDEKM